MTSLTQPLRDEHKELMPHVKTLQLAGEAIQETLSASDRALIDEALTFLTHHLIPHAQAEEKALYPVVQKVMGAEEATATMSRDHVEIGQLAQELDLLRAKITGTNLTVKQANALRSVLFGLHAIVKLHFAKEEEVYLPLLDSRLTAAEAQAMFSAMEEAAQAAKARLRVN
jgi:iron-sulfur cluster repair protein YtfE (RIC family)